MCCPTPLPDRCNHYPFRNSQRFGPPHPRHTARSSHSGPGLDRQEIITRPSILDDAISLVIAKVGECIRGIEPYIGLVGVKGGKGECKGYGEGEGRESFDGDGSERRKDGCSGEGIGTVGMVPVRGGKTDEGGV